MGLLDELYGVSPDGAADLEFRRGANGLEAGRKPGGVQGLLGDLSSGSDSVMAKIAEAEAFAKANGGRQSPIGWLLGQLMAGVVPSMVGSAARVAKAPIDAMQGRDVDLRGSDALLALPAAGPAARAAAPALRMSPEAAGILGTGGAGFGYGFGVASDANADSGGRVTLPTQRSRAEFEQGYNVPRPTLRSVDEAAKAARSAYEATGAYKSLLDQKKALAASTQANRIEAEARANYAGERTSYEKALKDWEDARERAWTAEQGDYDDRLKAFQNQGFWDRNPEVKPYAMGAAYALPALFGAGTAVQRGRTQQRLTDAIMGDDIVKAAAASKAAEKYLNPTVGQQAMKATGTVLAAGAPFELRSIGDAADAVFAPEGSGAQKRAKKHFEDPLRYMAEGAPQLLTGAMLYGMGNKAGSLATRDAKSMLSGAASPEAQAAIEQAAARRVAGIEGQANVDRASSIAAMERARARGLLAEAEGNSAAAERAAQEARRRTATPAPGLLDDGSAAVQPQRQPPPPAPVQNQPAVPLPPLPQNAPQPAVNVQQAAPEASKGLAIPAGMRPNPNWEQNAPAARAGVLEWLKKGGHLGKGDDAAMKAKDLLASIDSPSLSVQSAQGALKRLRDVLAANGLDPSSVSATQMRKVLKELPPGYFSGGAVAVGAGGLLDWGD